MLRSADERKQLMARNAFAAWMQSSSGVVLSLLVGAIAFGSAHLLQSPMASPLIVALVLGAMVRTFFGSHAATKPGIKFVSRHVLRAGIVLLGLQLSVVQVMSIGVSGVLIVVGALVATFLLTLLLGAVLGVDMRLTQLIAAGTSICGASAVVATNTVARAEEEDVGYALACVSLFGTAAVFLFPVLGHYMRLNAESYGLWAGASIHEIGQVAAATQARHSAGEIAMVAKLSRVALLAPTVLLLGAFRGRQSLAGSTGVAFPWFLLGFIAMMLVGSSEWVSAELKRWGGQAAVLLLTLALGALGLELDLRKLRTRGWRPLLLGAVASVFIALLTLGCILIWRTSP